MGVLYYEGMTFVGDNLRSFSYPTQKEKKTKQKKKQNKKK
jgi:hypothetical protein